MTEADKRILDLIHRSKDRAKAAEIALRLLRAALLQDNPLENADIPTIAKSATECV